VCGANAVECPAYPGESGFGREQFGPELTAEGLSRTGQTQLMLLAAQDVTGSLPAEDAGGIGKEKG